jgi:excisionase family DNA binding protein
VPLVIDNETYYTAAEAARYLHISRDTFYENVKGKLQPYQHGFRKRVYYRESDLDKLQNVHPISPDKDDEHQ